MTFGDLMSLLLTFFILLVSMSEIKSEDAWRVKTKIVQENFGLHGGGSKTPGDGDPTFSMMPKLAKIYMQQEEHRKDAPIKDPAVAGREILVTMSRKDIRRGVGSVIFESGSAKLSEIGEQQVRRLANLIIGANQKIELQGHASASEAGVESDYPDLWALTQARTQVVMNYMVDEMGIRRKRIRLVANADNEPMKRREYKRYLLLPNRRVEIVISTRLVSEFTTSISD
jgi:chemotaxis protein MotB